MARSHRHTIYDIMDANGVFDRNPANPQARGEDGQALYEGPVRYPMMLYHPKGETFVSAPGEQIVTPFGPKLVGELHELVNKIVKNEEEEEALRLEGWHDHPAKAIAAAGGEAPPMGAGQRIEDLEKQLEQLQSQISAANKVKSRLGKPKLLVS